MVELYGLVTSRLACFGHLRLKIGFPPPYDRLRIDLIREGSCLRLIPASKLFPFMKNILMDKHDPKAQICIYDIYNTP